MQSEVRRQRQLQYEQELVVPCVVAGNGSGVGKLARAVERGRRPLISKKQRRVTWSQSLRARLERSRFPSVDGRSVQDWIRDPVTPRFGQDVVPEIGMRESELRMYAGIGRE